MSDQIQKTLKGVNGQLEVYDDKVIIRRSGIMSKLTQGFLVGEKTVYLHQITSIKVKKAGFLTNGFIQFTLAGNLEFKKGLMGQTHDENTVMFRNEANNLVQEIKQYIESRISTRNTNVGNISTADELIKFQKLLVDGVISKEEFEQEKKRLLQ